MGVHLGGGVYGNGLKGNGWAAKRIIQHSRVLHLRCYGFFNIDGKGRNVMNYMGIFDECDVFQYGWRNFDGGISEVVKLGMRVSDVRFSDSDSDFLSTQEDTTKCLRDSRY